MSRILALLLVIAVIVFVVAIVLYWAFYRQRINKQLHSEAPHTRKLLSPWAFSIIAAFVVLIAFAGLTTIMALTDFGAEKVPLEYRNAVYDYRDFSSSQMTGYRSLYSIDENPGYTKSVEQVGDIRFTCFIRNEAFNYYHPSFIVYAEYTGDKNILYRGIHGSFYAPDDRQMASSGSAGGDFEDYICVIGTSTIQSRFELSIYLFDSGIKSEEWPPDDWATVAETITIVIPNP